MNIERITELCNTVRQQADELDADASGKMKIGATLMQIIAEMPQDEEGQAKAQIPIEVFEALGPDLRFLALAGFIGLFMAQIQKV